MGRVDKIGQEMKQGLESFREETKERIKSVNTISQAQTEKPQIKPEGYGIHFTNFTCICNLSLLYKL